MTDGKDMVSFLNIQRSYPPGEEMAVKYLIEAGSDLKMSKRDWVGLFRVGWTSSRDYYTFEWAPELADSETKEGSVKFAGRRLPPEDGHFYQLCFVSRDGTVRGASAPFQFAPLSVSLEDMELVEVTDDSMKSVMVLQKKSKEMESLRRETDEVRTELGETKQALTAAETQRAEIQQQFEATQNALMAEVETLKGEVEESKRKVVEKERQIFELESQVAAQSNSEQNLTQQLSQEQKRNKELLAVKENEEQELKVLKGRVSTVEGEVVVLRSEGEDLRQQVRIKESQVDDLQRLVGTRGEELEQVTEKLEAAEAENAQLHAACAELRSDLQQRQEEIAQGSLCVDITAALSQRDKHIEKLEQELACMQANIAELMGAQQTTETEQPQHSAPLPNNVVDKGAYIALQHAYETFEKYYIDEKSTKEALVLQLKTTQEECVRLQKSHQEMVQRVNVCKEQYEVKAQECIEMQRRLKKKGLPTTTATTSSDAKAAGGSEHMELENAEMVKNCQTAAEELSLRKREVENKDQQIASLNGEVATARQRYNELEDRFDKKLFEKNEEILRLKLVFEEKAQELAAIMTERDELTARVAHLTDSIKQRKEESSRCCPMCHMKFPLRMTEEDFEKHVHAHFESV